MSVEYVDLVVDPHTILENIASSIRGENFMTSFCKLYKLKIDTISKGLSMTSFERLVPKVFSSGNIKVIKADVSYLDGIPT